MRIDVDRDVCCGSGHCLLTAPAVFDQSDVDGLVILLDPQPPEPLHTLVRRAAHNCPSGAITITE